MRGMISALLVVFILYVLMTGQVTNFTSLLTTSNWNVSLSNLLFGVTGSGSSSSGGVAKTAENVGIDTALTALA